VSILEELKWRGLIADCTDAAELEKKIAAPITLYSGFDPTADSLHVGHLVPLLALRRFQLLGHFPIALAGGATGSIGDPSWKAQERPLLTKEILEHNVAGIKPQLAKLLDFESKQNPARLVDNASWMQNISCLDFLRDVGKYFSVNQMTAKESIRSRMEDREAGISYTEFSYPLIQAFDFFVLLRDFNCELQIGGSDQWGNITAGTDLCRKKAGKSVFGLTLPLITKADGTKFGKTESGAIWLDPNKTKPEDFYQFWIRTDDSDVIRYLKFFTFLSREEIEELEKQHNAKPEARIAHQALAKEMRDLIHPEASGVAERISQILFGKLFDNYTLEDWEFLSKHWHSIEVEKSKLIGMPLIELLVLSGLCPSKGQARKDIDGGGISLNKDAGLTNSSPENKIKDDHLQFGKYLRLRKGKKNYVVVTAK
jgi:tyrosyl-tRNA synthetase